jgi:hypothetical protein
MGERNALSYETSEALTTEAVKTKLFHTKSPQPAAMAQRSVSDALI